MAIAGKLLSPKESEKLNVMISGLLMIKKTSLSIVVRTKVR